MFEKPKFQTPDLTAGNVAKLAELFPGAVVEGKVNIDLLRAMLGEDVFTDEAYEFTWVGKRAAIIEAGRSIRKTLRPCRKESRDWDTTENLYIEGDNLDVLKLLQESYLGKVKMVYIDPPYNTGSDFIYRDNFTQSREEYDEDTGVYDEDGDRMYRNTESNGRFHSDWCSMIYPRLVLVRNLLSSDGIIVINMDENEITNLQKLCSEVFGESNDLGTIIWDKRNPKGEVCGVAYQHEYILVYAKNKAVFAEKGTMQRPKKNAVMMLEKAAQFFGRINLSYSFEEANRDYAKWVTSQKDLTGGEKAYNAFDITGNVFQPVSMAAPDKPETRSHRPLLHPVTGKPCPVPAKGWRFPDKSMDELLRREEILFGNGDATQPRRKYLLKENMLDNISSLLYYGGSDTRLLASLGIPFDTPKVVDIVKEHVQSFTENNDIVLDFFSGSATTAHAVMQLNVEEALSEREREREREGIVPWKLAA
jgi:adenine-specific DNA-methyltransferase